MQIISVDRAAAYSSTSTMETVMPVWIAGIHQVRKDASGNIHVNLGSSTPCWNDESNGSTETD
jgi:hypothetical protein